MTTILSHEDVDRLLTERSPDARAALAGKVAVSLAEPGLTLGEIALAQDIVRILARDVEAKVRGSIAQALRDSRHLPRDVALRLAEDIDSVALPVLAESLVLTDADLVGLVRHGTVAKQETIASRPNLGEPVSDALITQAGEPAVATLMSNPTAQIGDASFDQAVTRFAGSDRVKQAMVLRNTLPPAVAERLVMLVTGELQQHLVRVHALSPGIASDIVLRSRESAIIRLSMGASEDELVRMVSQMQRSDRLTPSLLLRALCTGDIAFFEAAMAVKGDVPLANAQILIHERGPVSEVEDAGEPVRGGAHGDRNRRRDRVRRQPARPGTLSRPRDHAHSDVDRVARSFGRRLSGREAWGFVGAGWGVRIIAGRRTLRHV
jgi:uncharacterized protein (DUF2336 family)